MPRTLSFKVIVAGPPRVGKSTLIQQLERNEFVSEAEVAAGMPGEGRTDIVSKKFKVNSTVVTLNVWDAIGQTESLSTLFYRESVGIILLYDCTDLQSFEELSKFELKSENVIKNFESVTFFLAANKCDSDHRDEDTIMSGEEKAREQNYDFFTVSAQRGDGVLQMFQKMAETLQKKYTADPSSYSTKDQVDLQRDPPNKESPPRGSGCCD